MVSVGSGAQTAVATPPLESAAPVDWTDEAYKSVAATSISKAVPR